MKKTGGSIYANNLRLNILATTESKCFLNIMYVYRSDTSPAPITSMLHLQYCNINLIHISK